MGVNDGRIGVLIAGPTASGKSALALEFADRLNGIIVNADSMQVYDVLRIVTARPSAADEAIATHLLYGCVAPTHRYSTGEYVADVQRVIAQSYADRPLIFVGGTGLYFQALTKGFMQLPEIDPAIVAKWQAEVDALDEAGRAKLLRSFDSKSADALKVADPQRVVRALSVFEATGRSLLDWQADPVTPLLDGFALERHVINPDRDVLRQRIRTRFEQMMESGAVDEVAQVLALGLEPSLPAMKAIGVREIAAWQANTITRDEAVEKSVIATSQYAKRQRTWFRHHMQDWDWREG